MQTALTIVDASPTGKVFAEVSVTILSEKLTIRAIIEARVRQEVARFNADTQAVVFSGLVQPTDTESELNGYRLRRRRQLDPDAQVAHALDAFERNGFFMLVNDQQVDDLSQEIIVTPRTTVSFVKLVPLVGG